MRNRIILVRACLVFLLAVLVLAATARSSEAASSNGSPSGIRITAGPTVEHAGTEDAVVAWSTNVSSGTQVMYGTDSAHLDRVAQTPWGALTHRVTLKKLTPGTTYYYEVVSDHALGSGDTAKSGIQQFRTQEKSQVTAGK